MADVNKNVQYNNNILNILREYRSIVIFHFLKEKGTFCSCKVIVVEKYS